MLVSKKLLAQNHPIFKKMSNQEFVNVCNQVGIEVEQILTHYQMKNLQIAYIEEVVRHPNADKLNVAQVRLSKDEVVTVVCGAANIAAKKYAIYAPIGTSFLDGRVIEQKNIRGIDSYGMLCGYQELTTIGVENLSDEDADGIVILEKGRLGDTNIDNYISNNDTIYDLSLPSNRNDLNAIFLLVNELLFGMGIEGPLNWSLSKKYNRPSFKVSVDPTAASDFAIIYVPQSLPYKPNWHEKQILMSSGYKIRNNILDLMNLFTLCYGNPIHVYNAKTVNYKTMSVKPLSRAVKVLGLDQKEYELPSKSIGIYSNEELASIAGQLGLDKTKYDENESGIVIEIANFNSAMIRETARKTKIATKASALDSKPLSPWITQNLFEVVCEYFSDHKIKFSYGYKFSEIKPKIISYKINDACSFIGVNNFTCPCKEQITKDKYYIHPSRLDIEDVYDVYEEFLKIIDINKLKATPISFTDNELFDNTLCRRINKLKDYLTSNNCLETKTYNLCADEFAETFNFFNIANKITINNPLSKNREVMRKSAIHEMLKVLQYNIARKRDMYNIFEMQSISQTNQSLNTLSIVWNEDLLTNKIVQAQAGLNLLSLKSFIVNMFMAINVSVTTAPVVTTVKEVYDNQTIGFYANKKLLGYLARVKTNVLKKYDIHKPIYVACINLDEAFKVKTTFAMQPISDFPTVRRDVNVIIKTGDNSHLLATKIAAVKQIKQVKDCWIKDVFDSEQNKTYTIGIEIASHNNTLQTSEIEKILHEIKTVLEVI